MTLAIRTDKPEAELYVFEGNKKVGELVWHAHRQLAETLHAKINQVLGDKTVHDVSGIVVFAGPGSFTGLRIGISVANAFAASLNVPIVSVQGENWLEVGIERLHSGNSDKIALPEYGSEAHITQPRK